MSTIDDIKSRLDIVEVIGESVSLRKTGRSYLGFCPFHQNTRTPAFTVYPDTQSFYCFGCQASGTVFDFVMRQQGLDFREALHLLAQRAGIQIKPQTEEEQQQDQQRTRLLEITSLAARYFNYMLLEHTRGQPGRDYLDEREIWPATREAFQLGYSLNERGHLLRYLTERKGFDPEEVEAAGLIIHGDYGYYDRFRGRLIFPIRNARGEVVGFGGRALGDVQPKYLNTPQTLLFDKSQVLYGLDLARDAIRSSDATVVVEGYVDVITAHQHGFRNVVAPLGTALTAQHVGMLKKLSHNVYLALDADAAGQRATLRGLSAFAEAPDTPDDSEGPRPVVTAQGLVSWQRDVTLRMIKLPPGRDPDDVIKSDPQLWESLIAAAQPVMDFYIDAYTSDLNLAQPTDQNTALERLLPLVRQLDSTQQRVYIARLEQVIGIRAELILGLLGGGPAPAASRGKGQSRDKSRERPRREPAPLAPPSAPAATPAAKSPLNRREDYLLALLLRHPSALQRVQEMLASDLEQFPQVQLLLGDSLEKVLEQTENRLIWQAWHSSNAPVLTEFAAAPAPPADDGAPSWVRSLYSGLHTQLERLAHYHFPQHQEYRFLQDAEQCVRHMRREQALRWQRRLPQQIHNATTDEAERQRLERLLAELDRYVASISAPRRTRSWTDLRDSLGKDPYE
jgi:DNA primase